MSDYAGLVERLKTLANQRGLAGVDYFDAATAIEELQRERDEARAQINAILQAPDWRRRAEAAEALLARQAPVVEAARFLRAVEPAFSVEERVCDAEVALDRALAALDQGSEGK